MWGYKREEDTKGYTVEEGVGGYMELWVKGGGGRSLLIPAISQINSGEG